jgi:hypothetical protein
MRDVGPVQIDVALAGGCRERDALEAARAFLETDAIGEQRHGRRI